MVKSTDKKEKEPFILFIPCTFNLKIDEMLQDIDDIIERIIEERIGGRINLKIKKTSDSQALLTRKYNLTWDNLGVFEFKLECKPDTYQLTLTIINMSNIPFNVAKDLIMQLEIGIDLKRVNILSHFTGSKMIS